MLNNVPLRLIQTDLTLWALLLSMDITYLKHGYGQKVTYLYFHNPIVTTITICFTWFVPMCIIKILSYKTFKPIQQRKPVSSVVHNNKAVHLRFTQEGIRQIPDTEMQVMLAQGISFIFLLLNIMWSIFFRLFVIVFGLMLQHTQRYSPI